MKVLFVSRRGVFSTEGGEQTQIHATAAALGGLGVGAEIVSDLPDDYARYDLVLFFGLDQDHIDKISSSGRNGTGSAGHGQRAALPSGAGSSGAGRSEGRAGRAETSS